VDRRRDGHRRHQRGQHARNNSLFEIDHGFPPEDVEWQNAGIRIDLAMTGPANPLTRRATGTPTGRDLHVMLGGFERLGFDVAAMLAAAGLTRDALAEHDGMITVQECERFYSEAARQRTLPNLPLRLACEIPMGAYPLLDYLVLSSATVADGLRRLSRYLSLTSEAIAFDVEEDADATRIVYTKGADFAVEYAVALALRHLRDETDGRLTADYVTFTKPPDDPDEYARAVGCPVRAAGWAGFVLSPAAWRMPMRRGDPVLCQVLEEQASSLANRRDADDGMVRAVRRALTNRLSGGDTTIAAVAKELATTPRTLQRRLSEEGWSFQTLVEDTRRRAAAHYLGNRSLSIAEVSYLLGFSEVAAFHRAFRRWHGCTPGEFRAAL
jgi:AraC-like DNA-binding protein